MKILYIGMYGYDTGWGHAAVNDILSLHAAGIDVVPRSLMFNRSNERAPFPEIILELEKGDASNCNICIQQMLPNYMEYNGHFDKNIGSMFYETSNFKRSGWTKYLNMMDEVWVPDNELINICANSGVTKKVHVIPQACDPAKFLKQYKPYQLPNTEGKFVFYTIAEFRRRKNISGLLKAFHTEFAPYEPVALVIKGGLTEMSAGAANNHIQRLIYEIKTGLRLYKDMSTYIDEIVISNHITDEEIMRLHSSCDCFVLPSHGEAWSIPAFDAMCMGKTPIVTNEGGPADYVGEGGWLIPCTAQPLFGMIDQLSDLYSADQDWKEPDLHALRKMMREAYENKQERDRRAQIGRSQMMNYTYDKIGNKMKEVLESNV